MKNDFSLSRIVTYVENIVCVRVRVYVVLKIFFELLSSVAYQRIKSRAFWGSITEWTALIVVSLLYFLL